MIRTVAWHEFWFTVTRKSWYLVTLGMPLLVLGYIGVVSLILLMTVPGEIERLGRPVGLVDRSGILTGPGAALSEAVVGSEFILEKPEQTTKSPEQIPSPENLKQLASDAALVSLVDRRIVVLKDVESGRNQLLDDTWNGIIVVPEDHIESGKLEVYTRRSKLLGSATTTGWVSQLIQDELLKNTSLTDSEAKRVRSEAVSTEFEIGEDGKFAEVNWRSKALSLGIPLAVAGLLIVALIMNASQLLASIAEEKENKVMEVILSSVSADQLLFGKVLGIVCAGLLQIAIWMAMVSAIPLLVQSVSSEFVDYQVNLPQLLISGVFMVTGFVFYGSLLAGMGSLGSTYKDCQQLSAAVIVCACVPMMMPTVFVTNPNAIVPRVLSMLPFFSPVAMTLRLGSGEIALWEVIVSFLLLLISTWFAIKIAARLFRAGTLMRGKPPGVRQILKVLAQRG